MHRENFASNGYNIPNMVFSSLKGNANGRLLLAKKIANGRLHLHEYKQYLKATNLGESLQPCTGYYNLNLGLPCSHTLQRLIDRGERLALTDIDPHWYYFRSRDRAMEA